jgi:hypothetical protein
MLSESDVAFLNNETPKSFDEATLYDIDTASNFNTFNEVYNTPSMPEGFTKDDSTHENNNAFVSLRFQNTVLAQHHPSYHYPYPIKNSSINLENERLDTLESGESDPLLLSSVSETKVLKALPKYSTDSLDDIVLKIVTSEPLLTEEDLLYLVKKEYTGHLTPSRRMLEQILLRNGFQTEYKRFQAYISG